MSATIVLVKGGSLRLELFPADAPHTVALFTRLANAGRYDGLSFHRVIPGLVIQAGDPRGDGSGRHGPPILDEFNARPHRPGAVGIVRTHRPDSATGQFYVCLGVHPVLDGNYTIFGQVIDGLDALDGIAEGDCMARVAVTDGPRG